MIEKLARKLKRVFRPLMIVMEKDETVQDMYSFSGRQLEVEQSETNEMIIEQISLYKPSELVAFITKSDGLGVVAWFVERVKIEEIMFATQFLFQHFKSEMTEKTIMELNSIVEATSTLSKSDIQKDIKNCHVQSLGSFPFEFAKNMEQYSYDEDFRSYSEQYLNLLDKFSKLEI